MELSFCPGSGHLATFELAAVALKLELALLRATPLTNLLDFSSAARLVLAKKRSCKRALASGNGRHHRDD